MYRKYADDTFLVFNDLSKVELFRSFLNSQHPNIHFTLEHEQNNQLNFLDMTITHTNGHLATKTYRKPTHSGLGTHYTSFIPHTFKTNSLQTLIYRAYTTCSSWINFHVELTFLTNFFQQNGYPTNIIHKFIHRFLHNLHTPKSPIATAPKEKLFVRLPFLGPLSYHTKKQLSKLLNRTHPQLNLQFIFFNKQTIGSLFPFKDRVPSHLQSFVVYQYRCSCAAAQYVGQTSCNFAKRIAEHRGVSERTGARLSDPPYSAIREHARLRHHDIDPENFNIIGTARNHQELNILESLHIKFKQPSLNRQLDTENLITI